MKRAMTIRQEITQAVYGMGPRLRARRLELSLLQREVAARGGFDPKVISRFETGKHRPDLCNFLVLAKALDCPIDRLLGRKKPHE